MENRRENKRAVEAGTADATDWLSESERDDWEAAVNAPLGADEGLINAIGSSEVAQLFGVKAQSRAFFAACGDYSKAWRDTVLEALAIDESEGTQ